MARAEGALNQLEAWGMRYGVSSNEIISQMGAVPELLFGWLTGKSGAAAPVARERSGQGVEEAGNGLPLARVCMII